MAVTRMTLPMRLISNSTSRTLGGVFRVVIMYEIVPKSAKEKISIGISDMRDILGAKLYLETLGLNNRDDIQNHHRLLSFCPYAAQSL
jgi:hypothetical protein